MSWQQEGWQWQRCSWLTSLWLSWWLVVDWFHAMISFEFWVSARPGTSRRLDLFVSPAFFWCPHFWVFLQVSSARSFRLSLATMPPRRMTRWNPTWWRQRMGWWVERWNPRGPRLRFWLKRARTSMGCPVLNSGSTWQRQHRWLCLPGLLLLSEPRPRCWV